EGTMNRRSVLSVSAVMALAAAVMPSSVAAQEKSLKDQLVGTWIFVSAQDVKPDGTKVDPWGPNPKGVAMYDAKGRFTFIIMRSDLPKFVSNNGTVLAGTDGLTSKTNGARITPATGAMSRRKTKFSLV